MENKTKVKKVAINQFDKVYEKRKETSVIPYQINNEETIEITVKKYLSFSDMYIFVNSVVNNCFDDEGNYLSYIKDFVIKSKLISIYTNLRTPDNIEKLNSWIYNTTLCSDIKREINSQQYFGLIDSIDDEIERRIRLNRKESKLDVLFNDISNLVNKFSENFDTETIEKITSLADALKGKDFTQDDIVNSILNRQVVDDDGEEI